MMRGRVRKREKEGFERSEENRVAVDVVDIEAIPPRLPFRDLLVKMKT